MNQQQQVQAAALPNHEFHELAGRLEGAVRALMTLAARLEQAGVLDGPQYSAELTAQAATLRFERPHLLATQRTLRELGQAMNANRRRR